MTINKENVLNVKPKKSYAVIEVSDAESGVTSFNTIPYSSFQGMATVEFSVSDPGETKESDYVVFYNGMDMIISKDQWLELWEDYVAFLDRFSGTDSKMTDQEWSYRTGSTT